MPIDHEKVLREFGWRAMEVAALITQGSIDFEKGVPDPHARAPDTDLQSIERKLGEVARAIDVYLRSRGVTP